jgi:hypothetical protein
MAGALLVTDSAIIRHTTGGGIRHSLADSDLNLQPLPRDSAAGGLFIVMQRAKQTRDSALR